MQSMLIFHHQIAHAHHQNSETKAKEATLQPQTYQYAQPKGQEHTSPQKIISAHKNTPCKSMQGGVKFSTQFNALIHLETERIIRGQVQH